MPIFVNTVDGKRYQVQAPAAWTLADAQDWLRDQLQTEGAVSRLWLLTADGKRRVCLAHVVSYEEATA